MNQSTPQQPSVPLEESPSFTDIESRVFTIKNGQIYIGTTLIDSTMRSLLRDEAENLKNTRLWEILNASIINESYNLALIQSKNFEEVTSAKMLRHWAHFMLNVIYLLSKRD